MSGMICDQVEIILLDSGEDYVDKYTIVLGCYWEEAEKYESFTLGCSGSPFNPQGFGMHTDSPHTAFMEDCESLAWGDLPVDVCAFVLLELYPKLRLCSDIGKIRLLATEIELVDTGQMEEWTVWELPFGIDEAVDAICVFEENLLDKEVGNANQN